MWMHIDSIDYGAAKLGVAVSDTPAGPFKYLRSLRPNNNQESRDMTIFVDEVGRPSKKDPKRTEGKGNAYVAYSSEMNKVLHISRLTGKRVFSEGVGFFSGFFFRAREKGEKTHLVSRALSLALALSLSFLKNRRLPRPAPDLQEQQLHARGGEF